MTGSSGTLKLIKEFVASHGYNNYNQEGFCLWFYDF